MKTICFLAFLAALTVFDAATESETTETSDIKQQVNEFDNNGEFEDEVDEQESLESAEVKNDYWGCALTGGTCRRRYERYCARIYETCNSYCCSDGTCCPARRRRTW